MSRKKRRKSLNRYVKVDKAKKRIAAFHEKERLLRYFGVNGMLKSEIALYWGCSVRTVYNIIQRASKRYDGFIEQLVEAKRIGRILRRKGQAHILTRSKEKLYQDMIAKRPPVELVKPPPSVEYPRDCDPNDGWPLDPWGRRLPDYLVDPLTLKRRKPHTR